MDLTLTRESIAAESTPDHCVGAPAKLRRPFVSFSRRKAFIAGAMALFLALGIFLRIHPTAGFAQLGYDEHGYMVFLKHIQTAGLTNYDSVVRVFMARQYERPDALVPATRIGFLAPGYLCGQLLKQHPFAALQTTAALASILLLGVSSIFAYRMGGAIPMLGTTMLVATAPLQIQLAQHTFIDACFCFWAVLALWLLWENLQRPRHWVWLVAYILSLVMLVLTKESAAFVVVAIFALFALNYFVPIGIVSPRLIAATVAGPAIAVLFLAILMGGIGEFFRFFAMFATKQASNIYSIRAQDGAWYRYLVDLILMSPLLVTFALGRMLNLRAANRADLIMTGFLAASFLCMANVKYGVSLRYAAYWDVPLAWLACSQILQLSKQFARVRPAIIATGLLLILAAYGLGQYDRYFVRSAIYDPITPWLIRASDMEK